eukprot:TRINITY_DN1345_c0_g2_i1.p1 TRINITY_DN1345_c0_g2~~TRINITY_DN1345_c0_g2_i1.p1  ORF type:complete len:458 (-),score=93.13 TRINITY_DN1345_c0_g2_i1:527-1900(-)
MSASTMNHTTPCHVKCMMKVTATENPQALVISKSIEQVCFPEKMAQVAHAKGFSALIWRTAYSTPGYSAKCTWGSNTAPIPIYEVSSLSTALEVGVASRVRLVSGANPFRGISWFGPQIPLLLMMLLINLIKISICVKAFFPVQLRLVNETRHLTAAQIVLLSTIVSGVLCTIHSIDFMGQLHILPLPMWFVSYVWGFLFNFLSTFVLAKAMLSAEAQVRGVQFEKNRSALLNFCFGMFFLVNLTATILLGWDVYYSDSLTLVLNLSFVLFQAVVGIHFLLSKRRVLNLLHASVATKENGTIEEFRNLERMTFFLYLSGFFMIAFFLACLIAGFMVITAGSAPAVIYSSLFSSVFNALCGLCQVLSLPEKTTGIHYSFKKGTSSPGLDHVTKKSVDTRTTPKKANGHGRTPSEISLPVAALSSSSENQGTHEIFRKSSPSQESLEMANSPPSTAVTS